MICIYIWFISMCARCCLLKQSLFGLKNSLFYVLGKCPKFEILDIIQVWHLTPPGVWVWPPAMAPARPTLTCTSWKDEQPSCLSRWPRRTTQLSWAPLRRKICLAALHTSSNPLENKGFAKNASQFSLKTNCSHYNFSHSCAVLFLPKAALLFSGRPSASSSCTHCTHSSANKKELWSPSASAYKKNPNVQ